jgi:hypothetical protein
VYSKQGVFNCSRCYEVSSYNIDFALNQLTSQGFVHPRPELSTIADGLCLLKFKQPPIAGTWGKLSEVVASLFDTTQHNAVYGNFARPAIPHKMSDVPPPQDNTERYQALKDEGCSYVEKTERALKLLVLLTWRILGLYEEKVEWCGDDHTNKIFAAMLQTQLRFDADKHHRKRDK